MRFDSWVAMRPAPQPSLRERQAYAGRRRKPWYRQPLRELSLALYDIWIGLLNGSSALWT